MIIKDQKLSEVLISLLGELEKSGDIVVCSSDSEFVVKKIHDTVLTVTPHTSLSLDELYGVRSLILEAITDKVFFDWEKPTITGFTADQFQKIVNKLPQN